MLYPLSYGGESVIRFTFNLKLRSGCCCTAAVTMAEGYRLFSSQTNHVETSRRVPIRKTQFYQRAGSTKSWQAISSAVVNKTFN